MFSTLWPSNMKADYLCYFNSLCLPKFGKYEYKTTNKIILNVFSFTLELRIYHISLTWYEQENQGHKVYFEAFPQNPLVVASLHFVSWITKTLRVGPTDRYKRSQNS